MVGYSHTVASGAALALASAGREARRDCEYVCTAASDPECGDPERSGDPRRGPHCHWTNHWTSAIWSTPVLASTAGRRWERRSESERAAGALGNPGDPCHAAAKMAKSPANAVLCVGLAALQVRGPGRRALPPRQSPRWWREHAMATG
jgi:hypothetical protein